jgi:hypothetical protein
MASIPFDDLFPVHLSIFDLGRAIANLAEHGSEEGFHFTAGVVWAVENAHEAGQMTEDAARSILLAVYEDQSLGEVSGPAEDGDE